MSNPISAYSVLYSGMSAEDRSRLESDIAEALKQSAEDANKALILGVQKAATEAYSNLIVNPWPKLLEGSGSAYGFVSAMAEHIWALMLQSKPDTLGKYGMDKLIDAWKTNYPEQWKEAVGKDASQRIEELTERLEFQIKVNRREF